MIQANTKKKRKWLRILLPIVGVIVIFTAAVLLTSFYVANPTKGTPIARYDNPKSALLVIDVQNDTTSNKSFYGDTTEFVENVNQAIALAEQGGMEILYVKNINGSNPIVLLLSLGRYRKGTAGVELDGRLQLVNENTFSKSIGDSFSSKEFEEYLISKSVDTLYIVGADASACVYSTARGGTNRGYNVNVVEDAVISISDSIKKQMLQQYAADGVEVINLAQFEEVVRDH